MTTLDGLWWSGIFIMGIFLILSILSILSLLFYPSSGKVGLFISFFISIPFFFLFNTLDNPCITRLSLFHRMTRQRAMFPKPSPITVDSVYIIPSPL